MPLIAYECNCGHQEKKFIRQAKEAPAVSICPKCGNNELKRQLSSPSSGSKIVIDNGLMARSVEIVPDIIQINKERSEKNYKED